MSSRSNFLIAIIIAAVMLVPGITAQALENPTLLQAYACKDCLDMFVAGDMDTAMLSCKVSNRVAEVTDAERILQGNVTVRTTVLLDISTSMPKQMRTQAVGFIKQLVDNLKPNEMLRIATFGMETSVIHDFTADRYDLSQGLDEIKFDSEGTLLYDSVYNTEPVLEPVDDGPCFARTIVITDGVDLAQTGITKEELYLKLQAEHYPVDVVAVSKTEPKTQDKELAALVRISGGIYANLYDGVSTAELAQSMDVADVLWIRAVLPGELLDGSTRQVNLTDGTQSLEFDTKVAVYDKPEPSSEEQEESVPASEAEPEAESEHLPESEPEQLQPSSIESQLPPVSTPVQAPTRKAGNMILIIIIAAIVLIVAAIVIAVVVSAKKRKQANTHSETTDRAPRERDNRNNATDDDRTEIVGQPQTSSGTSSSAGGMSMIRLRDTASNQMWEHQLVDTVTLGRSESCAIVIPASVVSRNQCHFQKGGDGSIIVVNDSNSNITKLNGTDLLQPTPIKTGDELIFGTVKVIVEKLGTDTGFGGATAADDALSRTRFVNV